MATNRRGDGETVDHLAAAAIAAGDVVVLGTANGVSLGIATGAIANGAVGPVTVQGRWNVAKVSAAVIKAGETVIWDASASEFDDNAATPATGDVTAGAIAAEDAGNGVTDLDIILTPGSGTIT
jgi:predicted RecA/RadA family phage recombinase